MFYDGEYNLFSLGISRKKSPKQPGLDIFLIERSVDHSPQSVDCRSPAYLSAFRNYLSRGIGMNTFCEDVYKVMLKFFCKIMTAASSCA